MKNYQLLIILIIVILLIAYWDKVKAFFNQKPTVVTPKEGDACTVTVGGQSLPGTIKSGVCVVTPPPPPLNGEAFRTRSDDKVLVNQRVIRGFVMEGLPSTCPDWSNHLVVGLPKGIISSPDKVCFLVNIDSNIDVPCVMFKGKKYKFTFKDIIIYNGVKWQRYCYNKV